MYTELNIVREVVSERYRQAEASRHYREVRAARRMQRKAERAAERVRRAIPMAR